MFSRLKLYALFVLPLLVLLPPQATSTVSAAANAVRIPLVESDHPYANNEDTFWTIPNDSGKNASRIYFSRIELEAGADSIKIYDENDTLIQEITQSHPDGLWTDTVPGALVKIALKSDGADRFWGFAVEQMEALDYTTLHYSPHPYPNNSTAEKLFINSTPNPAGTRAHFDRIELEDGVDYIVIKDVNDVPFQWITGSHPSGFTSKAVPGSAVKVQLVTDGSGRAWGYNLDRIETAPAEIADNPPMEPALAETDHPYSTTAERVWVLTNPNVNAKSTKVHFNRIDTIGATIQILDADDTIIQTFGHQTHKTDIWSDYVPGRIVKIKFLYQGHAVDWGFRIDKIVDSISTPGLAETDHPYSTTAERVWVLTNPNVNAKSTKVHFNRIDTIGATIQILDADDTIIQTFGHQTHKTDIWSDYVPGRIVKIKFLYQGHAVDWGFRIDDIQPASETNPPAAGINAVVLQINEPGDVYLNDVKLFHVSQAGEYKIPLSEGIVFDATVRPEANEGEDKAGQFTVRLEYPTHTQTIEITVAAQSPGGGIAIVYLPLVEK